MCEYEFFYLVEQLAFQTKNYSTNQKDKNSSLFKISSIIIKCEQVIFILEAITKSYICTQNEFMLAMVRQVTLFPTAIYL